MIYKNNKKEYKVESVTNYGMSIQVNGTTITDVKVMKEMLFNNYDGVGYTVFVDSDEIYFDTFDKAYEFAMTKQKNTFSI
mgnify:CR=1 FL=1